MPLATEAQYISFIYKKKKKNTEGKKRRFNHQSEYEKQKSVGNNQSQTKYNMTHILSRLVSFCCCRASDALPALEKITFCGLREPPINYAAW